MSGSKRGTVGRAIGATALGLSPYLGHVFEPLEALLSLFPTLPFDTQLLGIPLSAFVMGTTSFVVPKLVASERLLRIGVIGAIICLLLFVTVHIATVVHRPIAGGEQTASVLVGFTRPETCRDCTPTMSDVECLEYTTLNPSRIQSCWGQGRIKLSLAVLVLSYLGLAFFVGLVIGIVGRERTGTGALASGCSSASAPGSGEDERGGS